MPRTLIRPPRLQPGSLVATVSPSWGGPGTFPHRYHAGKAQLEATFGVTVVEMEHTLASAEFLHANPQARAADLMAAFRDPAIDGIFATIGGDDAIRLLPWLDLAVIRDNPKVFLGFSDTTAIHLACYTAGVTSFYGPSIMAGFGENGDMHAYTVDSLRRTLFETTPIGALPLNTEGWTTERLDWSRPELQSQARTLLPALPPRVLQGSGKASGHLLGGCVEVLEMVKGTAWWPQRADWDGAVLFYETSEDAPPPRFIRYWLRNLAAQGILQRLSGFLLARPDPGADPNYGAELETAVIESLAEAGLSDLPVISGHDFGHTQPMLTLPYGCNAELDCDTGTVTLLEAGVT